MAKYTLAQQAYSHRNVDNAMDTAEQEIKEKNLVDEPIIAQRRFRQAVESGEITPRYNVMPTAKKTQTTAGQQQTTTATTPRRFARASAVKKTEAVATTQTKPVFQQAKKKVGRYSFDAHSEAANRAGLKDRSDVYEANNRRNFVNSKENYRTLAHILSIPKGERTQEQKDYLAANKDNEEFKKYTKEFVDQLSGEDLGNGKVNYSEALKYVDIDDDGRVVFK